jgi:hypothetical protein
MTFVLAIGFIVAQANMSQAVIVAGWTFETSPPADLSNSAAIGPLSADVGTGSASGSHISAATDWTTPAGNGSVNSLSSNEWAVGDYYQFTTSTVGFSAVTLTFDQTSSNTGPRDWSVLFSTDGTTYSNVLDYSVLANASPNPVWNTTTSSSLYTTTLSLPAAANNDSSIFIRLAQRTTVSANGGTVATGGTSRVDNVTIAAVPEASSFLFGGLALCAAGAPAIRRRWKARKA